MSKKVTAREIARMAGVSPTTVSLVLNRKTDSISRETQARILGIARENGYSFKPAGASTRPLSVGIMVPTLSNLYYPFLVQQLEIDARRRGISTIIMNTLRRSEDEQHYVEILRKGMVDGIICLFSPSIDLPSDFPFIVVSDSLPGTQVDAISLNSYKAGYVLANHLIERGHREIAYISTPFSNITSARRYRMEGIHSRMYEANLENALTVLTGSDEIEVENSAYEYDCGYTLTNRLLESKKSVTAIIAVNDTTAAGCISALHDHGLRIPDDMAVCGFDNLLISKICAPTLTTVDQMAHHASKVGMDMLLEKIDHLDAHAHPINIEYHPHLIVRQST